MRVLVFLPHVLQADLLSLIDSTGHGLSTVVRRSWDTTAVRLSLEGTWSKCAEARKMAMLAVYQVPYASLLLMPMLQGVGACMLLPYAARVVP
jgi:hypothetical protein